VTRDCVTDTFVRTKNYSDAMLHWVNRSPGRAIFIGLALWGAVLVTRGKLTEHARFKTEFASAVWNWAQAGEHARRLNAEEQRIFFDQLASAEPPERWVAARKLGPWRDPKALWPLVAAMEDEAGTRRTCLMAQALGKLHDPVAVPALVHAAQHPRNVDLRVCAIHSLGEIGDESAVEFLAQRAGDESVSEADRNIAISALGEIGSPRALPALRKIKSTTQHPMLLSVVASAIHQIELLQNSAVENLLSAIGDDSDWIQDDWILAQLQRRWSEGVAGRLNEILRTKDKLNSRLKLQITALLATTASVESDTRKVLQASSAKEDRWLASLASSDAKDLRIAAAP
jgi:HEAT repeat protein